MGPCAKATVRCTIIAPDGQRFAGENVCQNPQLACPRLAGEDYTKCHTICRQVGHAEAVAAYLAGNRAVGGTAYLEGHTYACEPCKSALAAIGVREVVIGSPAQADTRRDGGDSLLAPALPSGPVPLQAGCAQSTDNPQKDSNP